MSKKNNNFLFNFIAPVYGLFYQRQKVNFKSAIEGARQAFDLTAFASILDVGCGTGALCSVLHEKGLTVTGIDPAPKMLTIARKHPENDAISFVQGSVLQKLPFSDRSFDLSIASYVAHGLQKKEREKMYAEMSRVSRKYVIIYDYNQKRALLTSIVEWLEGGDYFRFIKEAEQELSACFSQVRIVQVGTRAAWYICTPR
ncbi:MAG: class I SAM-dependent methyltransferase [Firmicutes bacterium]|nr:class I SAM-dependent methyltransferase [Bacillota bacterium]